MKWLICPGLPRAGTTYLFHNLASPANARHFNVPTVKETNRLFQDEADPPLAFENFDPVRYSLDFSPGYSMSPGWFSQQVSGLPADGSVKFIVPIRHPVSQAFAHYVHDVSSHIALDQRDNLHFPFFGDMAMRRYFIDRSVMFEALLARFGAKNVLFLNFHTIFKQLGEVARTLARFLEIDQISFDPLPIGGSSGMPFLLYGREHGDSIAAGATLYGAEPRALLMINGENSWKEVDVDAARAARAMSEAASWQRQLSRSVVECMERHVFGRAMHTYSALIGESLYKYSPDELIAKPASLPGRLAVHSRSLIERLNRGRDYAALATEIGYMGTPWL